MKNTYTLRKLFNDVHLWLGIASGLVLFVVCLSGTIYTFHSEIEEWLEPDKYEVKALTRPIPVDALVQEAEQELKGKVVAIEIPQDKGSTYRFSVAAPAGGAEHGGGRPTTYMVDPYTGAVKGTTEGPGTKFFQTMMQLHRWLLIDGGVGKMIVGIATIIFVFLTLTGLVLWFPVKRKNWKQGLKIKTNARWKRINHDLHNTLGFYSFLLLLVMALTGLCWSFDWYREGLSKLMGEEVFKGRREKPLASPAPMAGGATLQVSDYLAKANTILATDGNTRITLPEDDSTAVVVYRTAAGFFAFSAADKVQLSQHTGEPLKVEIFAEKPLNVQIVSLIKPLHLGEVYGTFSKILYFIACLIATSLPVTGTMIWINKLRKKPKKRMAASVRV
ncbi:PepSY-associated TM helix domain-containing protein [Pontibacter saemangeumensis]|uniref:PepSY-associated TM helix domain-containing protein n=1 Tax=Pontibacter saemangeumensis TaxID=1084525 RepID=A0ABP8LVW6_9BACT